MHRVLDILHEARTRIAEGWTGGFLESTDCDGRPLYCALGALADDGEWVFDREVSAAEAYKARSPAGLEAVRRLAQHSGIGGSATWAEQVFTCNDDLGYEATLQMYDAAIAELEQELKTAVVLKARELVLV